VIVNFIILLLFRLLNLGTILVILFTKCTPEEQKQKVPIEIGIDLTLPHKKKYAQNHAQN
jgi:hypothetical protein